MKLDIRKVKTYVISPGEGKYESRLKTALERLKNAGFVNVEHMKCVPDPNNTNSLSKTNAFIFEKEKHNRTPFIILEDDIQIDNIHSENDWLINIPKNASAIYLGCCIWVYPHKYHTLSLGLNIRLPIPHDHKSYNEDLVHIKGMTSAHAILFLNRDNLTEIATTCIKSHLGLVTAHDLILATLQQHYNIYALKKPIFYQDGTQGGQEDVTRVKWGPNFYISHTGRMYVYSF